MGWLIRNKKTSTLKHLIRAFFNWRIQSVIFLALGYVLFEVIVLKKLGLWDFSQIKNTIVWFFSIAFLSNFQMGAIKKDGKYLKRIVFDNLKLIALLQFVIDFYTFSLLVELILIPFLATMGIIVAVVDSKKEYNQVKFFLEGILSFFGLIFLLYAFSRFLLQPDDFLNKETGLDFITPILLTILYIPFLFFLVVFSSYETFLITLRSFIKNSKKRNFALFIAIIVFHVRISIFQRWLNSLYKEDTRSYSGIILSFRKIFIARKAERNPKFVSKIKGWSPYLIKDVLKSQGLITGFYKESSYTMWYACSDYLKIGSGIIPSNIAYYVNGRENLATELKLVLNLNRQEHQKEAHLRVCKIGKILFWHSVKRKAPKWLEKAILDSVQIEKAVDNFKIVVLKEAYPNKTYNGYSLSLIISVNNTNG